MPFLNFKTVKLPGFGRYALGATWYEMLTGNCPGCDFTDFDTVVSPENAAIALKIAHDAAMLYIDRV